MNFKCRQWLILSNYFKGMHSKRGIVLMNLGSPDSTSVKDVRRYLNEFLMDEKVIDVPYLVRMLLVKGIIVPFRAPKSAEAYRTIWTDEGSPLITLTKHLQQQLQAHVTEPVEIAIDRKSTRLNSSHRNTSRMPSSA